MSEHSPLDWAPVIVKRESVTVDSDVVRIVRVDVAPSRTAILFTEFNELINSKGV